MYNEKKRELLNRIKQKLNISNANQIFVEALKLYELSIDALSVGKNVGVINEDTKVAASIYLPFCNVRAIKKDKTNTTEEDAEKREALTKSIALQLRSRFARLLFMVNSRFSEEDKYIFGESRELIMKHIESQFLPGMTWENRGRLENKDYNVWQIDHIIPVSSFHLQTKENKRECFHYTNLQPLWAKDNRKKWAKLPEDKPA